MLVVRSDNCSARLRWMEHTRWGIVPSKLTLRRGSIVCPCPKVDGVVGSRSRRFWFEPDRLGKSRGQLTRPLRTQNRIAKEPLLSADETG